MSDSRVWSNNVSILARLDLELLTLCDDDGNHVAKCRWVERYAPRDRDYKLVIDLSCGRVLFMILLASAKPSRGGYNSTLDDDSISLSIRSWLAKHSHVENQISTFEIYSHSHVVERMGLPPLPWVWRRPDQPDMQPWAI